MKEHSAADVRAWIDQLIGLDHLRVEGERYPTLYLSPSGISVMKAETPVTLYEVPRTKEPAPRRAAPAVAAAEEGLTVDMELFERLRALRRSLHDVEFAGEEKHWSDQHGGDDQRVDAPEDEGKDYADGGDDDRDIECDARYGPARRFGSGHGSTR